jgi:integrase/recombinase XerC
MTVIPVPKWGTRATATPRHVWGMYTVAVTPEWQQPIGDYLTSLGSARLSPGTIKLRSYHLRRFGSSIGLPPWAITTESIEAFIDAQEWSSNTARSAGVTLSSFFRWLHRRGLIDHDITEDLSVARPEHLEPRGRVATESDIAAGMERADPRTQLMLEIGAFGGLRACEIAVVHSDDVVTTDKGPQLLVHGKGRKQRLVPIPRTLARSIVAAHGYLFVGNVDGHLSAHYVGKLISRALPPGVTGHWLRHRFANVVIRGSRDIRALQRLLGHASLATTEVYLALLDDDVFDAAEHAHQIAGRRAA